MLRVDELRKVEVLQGDGSWVEVRSIGQLEFGDIFRAFEPTGEPVLNEDGGLLMRAVEPAGIDAEPYPLIKEDGHE